jgi:acetate---CoA ligase (ADP-forming)
MTISVPREGLWCPAEGTRGTRQAAGAALAAMLEARSVALVGASPRPATFGRRMSEEVGRSASRPRIYPVNPRYRELDGRPCYPSLAELPEAVDLVLLAVPDPALEQQLTLAAGHGARSAVIFGSAHEAAAAGDGPTLRERLAAIATGAGMQLCGAGCMGFINVSRGLRAIGYTEADPVPDGPVALVTHSGSVFSALLRARRQLGFTLAVSSGQELVTTAAAYLDYALSLPETRVIALILEAIRDGGALRAALARAAERDVPVVLLTTGHSAAGRAMVAAHSGALAAADGGWEALARAYGVHRVGDLAELTDTVELFAAGRRAQRPGSGPAGIATVHDSGLERAHVVDLADELGVPFASIGSATTARLTALLDPGLVAENPLDVWGTGADTRELFAGSLAALASDPAVAAVALAVDLVHELDGDHSYPLALLDAAGQTGKPVAVLSNLSSAIDPDIASQLRGQGVPVLEGTRTGLLALRHLLDHGRGPLPGTDRQKPPAAVPLPEVPVAEVPVAAVPVAAVPVANMDRQRRGRALLASGEASGAPLLGLLAEYGIGTARALPVADGAAALAAAESIGYPVVLKTDAPAVQHKSDVGGVVLGVADAGQLTAAYTDLAARLGPRALVCQSIPAGIELALGVVRDPELGPLIVIGAGGVLVELLADRVVALPPVPAVLARELVGELRVRALLAGARGGPAADLDAVVAAITGLSELALELGGELAALDVNPLICGPGGAIAVDALAIARQRQGAAGG